MTQLWSASAAYTKHHWGGGRGERDRQRGTETEIDRETDNRGLDDDERKWGRGRMDISGAYWEGRYVRGRIREKKRHKRRVGNTQVV